MEIKLSTKCPLCGGNSYLKQKECPGYQMPDRFNIYHCLDCNTAFSSPTVDATSIYESIYNNAELVPGYERYSKYAQIVKEIANPMKFLSQSEETYWSVNEALQHLIKDKATTKILEIGSGLGYLTYSLIQDNYNIKGLDISETAVKKATENFGNHYISANLYEYAIDYPESYDCIILTEVIEHVDSPLNFIKAIMKLLKSGGHAIITTPNKSIYPSHIVWDTELPPIHCWWFSEDSMKIIAKTINADINFIDFGDFYKKRDLRIDFNKVIQRTPYFDQNGELIFLNNHRPTTISRISHFISKIPFLKTIYRFFIKLMNSDSYYCSEKGIILCSVLKKK